MTTHALVLGGGGIGGISWEMGLLVGLAEAGVDVRSADLFVGTSAGSIVATLTSSGRSWEELLQRQVEVIVPDEAMKIALASVGGNVLDPALRGRAAHLGREQGKREAEHTTALWR